jgi:hypothetical protein
MRASIESCLRGRILDTADNWLPGVRLRVRSSGAEGVTDGNGKFEITFRGGILPEQPQGGAYDYLEAEKEGYRSRAIPLTDPSWLRGEPFEGRVEPAGVSPDTEVVRFRLNPAGGISRLPEVLGKSGKDSFTAEELEKGLAILRARAEEETEAAEEVAIYGWVDPAVDRIRATLIVALHGMGVMDHPILRRFAAEESVALVGFEGKGLRTGWWPVDFFDPYLARLGEQLEHPDLGNVPLLTFGHSNGTGLATAYASARPQQMLGWVSYHSGYAWQLSLPRVELSPGLVMHGQLDDWLKHGQEQAVKDLRRNRNAPVAMMLEGEVGHGPNDTPATWSFICDYYRTLLRWRLQDDGSLRPVAIEEGWLGDCYDRTAGGNQLLPVAPYSEYKSDRSVANWLPDGQFARRWQSYGAGGAA